LDTEDGRLCAKNSSWSAFTIEMVRNGITPIAPSYAGMAAAASAAAARLGAFPITYGSRIVLTDKATGTSTGPLIIRKVERGQIVTDVYGPVSQMQKVALEKATNELGSSTTTINAGILATGVVTQPTYLCAGYDANVVATTTADLSDTTAYQHKTEIKSSPFLSFSRPRIIAETSTECIDDHLCWTIVGLGKDIHLFSWLISLANI
jgi:recombining binding protein (suppressor of hairless)